METKEMARQVRLTHRAGVMRARTESGQSVRRWCRENEIQEKTYYYWQRKLREVACEHLEKQALSQQRTELSIPGFAEVKVLEPSQEKRITASQSELQIEIGAIKISATGNYPPEHIAEILKRLTC